MVSTNDKLRQKSSIRDENIRKQADSNLVKQNKSNTTTPSSSSPSGSKKKKLDGISTDLIRAQLISEGQTAIEAARLMAANRLDSLLITNSEGSIVGILTDKDLAFKLTAQEKDPIKTRVKELMTPNPLSIPQDFSLDDALELMVDRKFRHLPVMSLDVEKPTCIGMLDIFKCVIDAIKKIEKADQATDQLSTVLENITKVYKDLNNSSMKQITEHLKERLTTPLVGSMIKRNEEIFKMDFKANVIDMVKEMSKNKVTGGMIVDDQERLVGILTTKDVVLRIIAAGLDPNTTAVVRVMTPHPDTITTNTSLLDALKQMQRGHYLHLPVVDNNCIMGMTDVLEVTFTLIEQIKDCGYNATLWIGDNTEDNGSITSGQRKSSLNHPLHHYANFDTISAKSIEDGNIMTCKLKFGDQVSFVQAESLAQIKEIIKKTLKLDTNNLTINYQDDDHDLIQLTSELDFEKIIKMNKQQSKYRINLVIQKRENIKEKEFRELSRMTVGLGALVIGIGLMVFFIKYKNSKQ